MARGSLYPRIFLVSLLILFLEILVIRWISTEVRIYAYLHNMVLIAAFLGCGMGCCAAQRKVYPLVAIGSLALLVFLAEDPFGLGWLDLKQITYDLSGVVNVWVWFNMPENGGGVVARGLLLVMLSFSLIALSFFPLGQLLGQWLGTCDQPIRGYSFNILGSLAGIWLFNLMSMLWMPPPVWFAVTLLLYVPLLPAGRVRWLGTVLLLLPIAITAYPDESLRTVWTPYQRISMFRLQTRDTHLDYGYLLNVNNVNYQMMLNLGDKFVRSHPETYDPNKVRTSKYNLPNCIKPDTPQSVLIVGAGSGNDVAAVLRGGARRVVAVEIDPVIVALGRQYHPEDPYHDPRVELHVDDARAYLHKSDETFDMVIMALLDAHTQASSINNLRLDNYVYTRESFAEVRRHLRPHGLLVCSFAVPFRWMAERLARMLEDTFGQLPLAFIEGDQFWKYGWQATCFIDGDSEAMQGVRARLEADAVLRQQINSTLLTSVTKNVVTTSDDWPFLYLERPMLPWEHVAISLLVLALLFSMRRVVFKAGVGIEWPFFLLGSAFLLLEVHGINKAMLLFGSTWVVNAFIISTVLLLIYVANLVAERKPALSVTWAFAGVILTAALNLLVPLTVFQGLSAYPRAVGASLFLCAPVFFAGLIFARLFAAAPRRDLALGSNLLGAIVGGMLESLSFVWGMRVITLLVLVLYLFAAAAVQMSARKYAALPSSLVSAST